MAVGIGAGVPGGVTVVAGEGEEALAAVGALEGVPEAPGAAWGVPVPVGVPEAPGAAWGVPVPVGEPDAPGEPVGVTVGVCVTVSVGAGVTVKVGVLVGVSVEMGVACPTAAIEVAVTATPEMARRVRTILPGPVLPECGVKGLRFPPVSFPSV